MRRFIVSIFFSVSIFNLAAQSNTDTLPAGMLPEVKVRAFEQETRLRDVPAAVHYLDHSTFERFSGGSIVQAINTLPGLRMEERSPGSFRFNMRGSSLRSPFGVRNIKIYYNDLPLTDPGGQSYLNQLGSHNYQSLEVIKGPGSSLYGAGTGGVLLIEGLEDNSKSNIHGSYTFGSYRYHNSYVSLTKRNENHTSKIGFQHQQSAGYRNHSELSKDVFSWTGKFLLNEKNLLKTTFLYGNLFYETPGALTRSEFEIDPRMARPSAGTLPGAEDAKASIRQKTFLAGASYLQELLSNLDNKTVLYGMFTDLQNPAIRNYARSSEPHFGGRTVFTLRYGLNGALIRINAGAEYQQGISNVRVHNNKAGFPDTLQSQDEINNRQQFIFTQLSIDSEHWNLLAGISWNNMHLNFERFAPASQGKQKKSFRNHFSPRIALMRKIKWDHWNANIYTGLSGGFSPPTTPELLPTGSFANTGLHPEKGWNYEVGIKATAENGLYMDVNAFLFFVNQTIVQRRDSAGGDFFINAGKTRQEGIEAYISYPLQEEENKKTTAWLSYTWHHFHYKNFIQLNNDFSGKNLPATAPHTITSGIDLLMHGWLAHLTYYFGDRIPLNDANSEYASAYHLLGAKIGYQKSVSKKGKIQFTAGAENLLDTRYSLGNDINAFGGRYFNAAPGRNYFISMLIHWGE